MTTSQKSLEDDIQILGGLAEVHMTATTKEDFQLCQRVRATITCYMLNRPGWIKIESGLNLSTSMT